MSPAAAKAGAAAKPSRGQPAGNSRGRAEGHTSRPRSNASTKRSMQARDNEQRQAYENGRRHGLAGDDPSLPFDEALVPIYEAGHEDGTTERKSTKPGRSGGSGRSGSSGRSGRSGSSGSKGSAGAKGSPGAKGGTGSRSASSRRPSSSRRRGGAATRSYRSASRQLAKPVASQLGSGMYVIGLTLSVALLYNLVEHGAAAGKAIGGLGSVVRWISDPASSIPYKE